MSTVSSIGSQINNLSIALPSREAAAEKGQVDKVETGAKEKDDAGFIHKSFRLLGKAAGAPFGILPGAVLGARSELKETEPGNMVTPKEEKFLRGFGASAGAIMGAVAGAIALSPVGILLGVVGGTVLGAALAGGLPKGMDAAGTALKGMAKGSFKGMKKGAEYGGRFVDWVAAKFSGSHHTPERPAPAPSPQPA